MWLNPLLQNGVYGQYNPSMYNLWMLNQGGYMPNVNNVNNININQGVNMNVLNSLASWTQTLNSNTQTINSLLWSNPNW